MNKGRARVHTHSQPGRRGWALIWSRQLGRIYDEGMSQHRWATGELVESKAVIMEIWL